ncbi:type II toxin-antitoxin system MqsA family antitoxin [Pantoea allii]|uniref:helix-turn-helix domain-containing protein n=1 Tax=Pantoea allii TaxID=574096 RepID=UPI00397730AE
MKTEPAELSELLEDAKAFHALGLATDEEVESIAKRAKNRELRARIAAVKPMTATEIKDVRMRWGMSQSLVALSFGMTVDSVSKWERGEITPCPPVMRMLQLLRDNGPELFTSKHQGM